MKIAVLGTGAMAQAHLAAYSQMPEVNIASVFSRDRQRAETLAQQFQTNSSSDWQNLLRLPEIDAIDVCLPSAMHHDVVLAALRHGKHVLCETPFTAYIHEATDMISAASDAGRKLGVALLTPWASSLAWIHSRVTSGTVGQIEDGRFWRKSQPYRKSGSHHADALLELATFDFAYIDWVCGSPVSVMAEGEITSDGQCEEGSVSLNYQRGMKLIVDFSSKLPAGSPYESRVQLRTNLALLEMSLTLPSDAPPNVTLLETLHGRTSRPIEAPDLNPYAEEIRHFVNCIKNELDLGPMDATAARRALAIDRAVRQSISEQREIAVEHFCAPD